MKCWAITVGLLLWAGRPAAQAIIYAPDAITAKAYTDFDVIGKTAEQYVLYRKDVGNDYLLYCNEQLQVQQRVPLFSLKKQARPIAFLAHPSGVHLFTTYAQNKWQYITATLVNNRDFTVSEAQVLDSFPLLRTGASRFYPVKSKQGNQLALFRVNRGARSGMLYLDLIFFDAARQSARSVRLRFPSFAASNNIEAVELADNGNLFFVVAGRSRQGGYIEQLVFYELPAGSSTLHVKPVPVGTLYPERVLLHVNNRQQTCTLVAFASAHIKGNVDALFTAAVKMGADGAVTTEAYRFSDRERLLANSKVSKEIAFNDYYITDVVAKADGGLLVVAECLNTAARETNINRWQRPFPDGWNNTLSCPLNFSEQEQKKSVAYGALESDYNPTIIMNRTDAGERFFNAENLLLVSLNEAAAINEVKFFNKVQQSNIAAEVSFAALRRTDALLLFYNEWAPGTGILPQGLLISSNLAMERLPVIRGLQPGYRLLHRLAVQVSNHELLLPAVYKNRYVLALLRY